VSSAVLADNSDSAVAEEGMGWIAGYFAEVEVCFGRYRDGRRPATPPLAAYKCS
jgi:hypothetical protein